MEPGDFTRLTDWREEPATPGSAQSGSLPDFISGARPLVCRNLTGVAEWLARLLSAIGDIPVWTALVGFMIMSLWIGSIRLQADSDNNSAPGAIAQEWQGAETERLDDDVSLATLHR
jgi:hypothetical protein